MRKDNRILITGASGFVGKNLSRFLTGKGLPVNKCYGVSRKDRLSENEYKIDLNCRDADWSNALEGCKSVIHLASRVHIINEKNKNPLDLFRRINLEGTLELAKQAVDAGVEEFIFLSSIGVNGAETSKDPFRQDSPPKPHSPYAISKFEAERALRNIAENSNMRLIIIRAPAIYGKNAPGNLKTLGNLIEIGIPLPFLLCKNKRSLISIDNLVDFIYLCVQESFDDIKTFLVSDKNDLSTAEVINLIGKMHSKQARLFPFPIFLLRILLNVTGRSNLSKSLLRNLQIDPNNSHKPLNWIPPFQPISFLKNCD